MFGSEGLYAYNMNGELLWKKEFGTLDSGFFMVPDAQWGFASSPVIHNGRVILQVDVQKDSFVAAFDVRTGKELWRTAARGRADLEHAGRRQHERPRPGDRQRLEAHRRLRPRDRQGSVAHDRRRRHPGADAHRRARPGVHHQRARQVRADLRGEADGDRRHHAQGRRDRPTSTSRGATCATAATCRRRSSYGDILYVCRDNGVLSAFDAKTGTRHYQARLGDGKTGFSASAVAANGRLYFTSEDGDVYVVKAGPAYELLATNPLGEVAMATPAISEGTLLFRTRNHLVAVGER